MIPWPRKNNTNSNDGHARDEGGVIIGTVHGYKKKRITDHGYKSFVFRNHENKQVQYSFSYT